jgi:hypothetical protein
MDHTHIIINHDVGLHLVFFSNAEDLDLPAILDRLIVNQLTHATAGIQETEC